VGVGQRVITSPPHPLSPTSAWPRGAFEWSHAPQPAKINIEANWRARAPFLSPYFCARQNGSSSPLLCLSPEAVSLVVVAVVARQNK